MPGTRKNRLHKSEAEWRQLLTDEQFEVTRKGGTEPAFTGPYWDEFGKGKYSCVCCGAELFSADTKFNAHCGWPSFYAPVDKFAVTSHTDRSHFMERTEIRCATCEAHLGHVFSDGPYPTGLRYCMNGTALNFDPAGPAAPAPARPDRQGRGPGSGDDK